MAAGEGFDERWWSPISAQVRDATGQTVLLLHRVEDVTEFIRPRVGNEGRSDRELSGRIEEAEAELFARARNLGDLNWRLREAGERERLVSQTLQRAMLPSVRCQPGRLQLPPRGVRNLPRHVI